MNPLTLIKDLERLNGNENKGEKYNPKVENYINFTKERVEDIIEYFNSIIQKKSKKMVTISLKETKKIKKKIVKGLKNMETEKTNNIFQNQWKDFENGIYTNSDGKHELAGVHV